MKKVRTGARPRRSGRSKTAKSLRPGSKKRSERSAPGKEAGGRLPFERLKKRIQQRSARISVVGLGYVGLPLAVEFARAGFTVTGIDTDGEKVKRINQGSSYIQDVANSDLRREVDGGRLAATRDFSALLETDCVSICVPTPLRKTRDPDVSSIVNVTREIARYLHPEELVVLESTTYPGSTDELILPMLAETGLEVGEDFFLAFSPERVDPGNRRFTTRNIPKVVGGVTAKCTEVAVALYEASVSSVVPVSSTKVAEMVKLLENTFRSVNIGLVNETALMCDKMKIDVWEVIEAAATKPFGFMPFYPGPGLGGHCIPIDPFYLSWKAKLAGFEARFIELAGQVNASMPYYVVRKVGEALNSARKSVNGSKVLLLGVAYKADVDDARESPALDIYQMLTALGAEVSYCDPHVAEVRTDHFSIKATQFSKSLVQEADCVVITTAHSAFDYKLVVSNAKLIFDSRNALKGFVSGNIWRL
ncbi:MAG: nucleotide sugar dehydrogenase [Candidatus Eiseniibacteriota bacterium]|nr:MAG: nucleotide sugar dehydrogenase [Candidatus Eisenbacteria bacterium]